MKALFALLLLALFASPAHAQMATVVPNCAAQFIPSVGGKVNWTMDPQGRVCMGQYTLLSCQQSVNYLARTTGGDEGGNSQPMTDLICGLVEDGIIDGSLAGAAGCGTYLDGLYIFAQQNLADAKLNLCGTNFGLTVDAGTIFTAFQGFKTFPTGIDTNYNILTSPGRKWALGNAALGVWMYTFTPETFTPAGAPGNSALNPGYTGNVFYGRINGNLSPPWTPNPGTTGFYVAERADLNNDHLYYNGIDGGLKAGATVALVSTDVFFGKNGNATASTNGLSIGYMGAPLGPALQLAFYNRLAAYMDATTPCQPAMNYLARTTGGNEGGNSAPIIALICGLVFDGVITGNLSGATGCGAYLDALYIMAQQNQADALLNLCGTSYPAVNSSSLAFTAYKGFVGNVQGIDLTFDPTTAPSPRYTLNSASYGAWAYAVVVEAVCQICQVSGSQLYNNYTGSLFYARLNNIAGGSVPAPGQKGYYVADRASAANVHPFWNGIDQGAAPTSASVSVIAGDFFLGKGSQTMSAAHIGASLGPALELALYNRLRTYMTAVGVP